MTRKPLPTLALVVGALYCLFPVVWVAIAATKTRAELFSTTAFLPSFNGGLWDNLGDLFAYQDGQFWRWALNSVLYAGVGARAGGGGVGAGRLRAGEVPLRRPQRDLQHDARRGAAAADHPRRPAVPAAAPRSGLAGTYWSVLLPSGHQPVRHLPRAGSTPSASVPTEMLEAGRIDGAGEWRLFRSVALPLMAPGAGDRLPAPVRRLLEQLPAAVHHALATATRSRSRSGCSRWSTRATQQPALYALAIAGALISIIPLIALFLDPPALLADRPSGAVRREPRR